MSTQETQPFLLFIDVNGVISNDNHTQKQLELLPEDFERPPFFHFLYKPSVAILNNIVSLFRNTYDIHIIVTSLLRLVYTEDAMSHMLRWYGLNHKKENIHIINNTFRTNQSHVELINDFRQLVFHNRFETYTDYFLVIDDANEAEYSQHFYKDNYHIVRDGATKSGLSEEHYYDIVQKMNNQDR